MVMSAFITFPKNLFLPCLYRRFLYIHYPCIYDLVQRANLKLSKNILLLNLYVTSDLIFDTVSRGSEGQTGTNCRNWDAGRKPGETNCLHVSPCLFCSSAASRFTAVCPKPPRLAICDNLPSTRCKPPPDLDLDLDLDLYLDIDLDLDLDLEGIVPGQLPTITLRWLGNGKDYQRWKHEQLSTHPKEYSICFDVSSRV